MAPVSVVIDVSVGREPLNTRAAVFAETAEKVRVALSGPFLILAPVGKVSELAAMLMPFVSLSPLTIA